MTEYAYLFTFATVKARNISPIKIQVSITVSDELEFSLESSGLCKKEVIRFQSNKPKECLAMFKRWDFERTSVNCDNFLGPAQVPKSASCKMKILCVLVCTSRACYIFMSQLISSNIWAWLRCRSCK